MVYSNGPSIVRDGLVLLLDAADRNSYPRTGTTWYDLSGRNNHGSATSVSYNSDGGGCFYSNGSTATSKFEISSSDFQTDGVTVEVWLKTIALGDSWIFCLQTGTSNNYGNGWLLRMDSPTYNLLWAPPGFRTLSGASGDGIILNTWQHIVASNDPDTDVFRFCVNGETKLTSTASSLDYTGVRDYAYIGAHTQAGSLGMNARISTAKVYNRGLSFEEITQNYNATKGRFGL